MSKQVRRSWLSVAAEQEAMTWSDERLQREARYSPMARAELARRKAARNSQTPGLPPEPTRAPTRASPLRGRP